MHSLPQRNHELLAEAGYEYDDDLGVFINQERRSAMSYVTAAGDVELLKAWIDEEKVRQSRRDSRTPAG